MTAPAAAAAAGITYRQLDYWSRQGWITASSTDAETYGRPVRLYDRFAVARLAALRHLARSGHDVAALGPVVGQLELSAGTLVVVDDAGGVRLVGDDELLDTVTSEGRWAVFDPTPFLDPTTATTGEHASSGPRLRAVDHEERSA
jgi:hypothetical protein